MSFVRRVLSLVLACLLMMCVLSTGVSAKSGDFSRPVKAHIHFNEDGKLRILQIADLQDDEGLPAVSKRLLRAAVKSASPDLIMMTGDNFAGYSCHTKEEARKAIDEYMSVFSECGVPVAIVFGNHDDDETAFTKEEQIDYYARYDCFIGCKGVIADKVVGDNSTRNVGTYNIPVFASAKSNRVLYNIWCIDSGNYNPDPEYGGYSYALPEQVQWYVRTSKQLQRANGGKAVPSIAFQHIPPVQIYQALQEIPVWIPGAVKHEKRYYRFPDGMDLMHNWMYEDPSTPNIDCPQAYAMVDAMVERGDVKAVFFGHDHVNGYTVPYKGIDLVNSPACTIHAYNNQYIGFRLIELDRNDLQSYRTELLNAFALLGQSMIDGISDRFLRCIKP